MSQRATVVSAFYMMKSKYPGVHYLNWIRNFLETIPCNLVFFTDEDLLPILKEMREPYMDRTRFVVLPREEWKAYTRYGQAFWEHQNSIDHERLIHSADLYAIWYEKKEFVLRAIEMNPFGDDRYIWCDAGAFRYKEWFDQLKSFGGEGIHDIISSTSMSLLQVEPFTAEDRECFQVDQIGDFDRVNRIGGGIQGGAPATWKQWSTLYDQKLQERVAKGMFVGKDQTVMAAVVLQYPELVKIVPADRSIGDHWFTLLFHFSPTARKALPFFSILIPLYNGEEFLAETLESIRAQTFQDYEILIGINGYPKDSELYKQVSCLTSIKIRVLDLWTCHGKAEALNAMVKEAKANWIALCDADDLWIPQKLEIQHACITQFQDAFDVIGTQCEYFGDKTGSPSIPLGDISSEDFFAVNPLLNSSVVLRKSLANWNPENRIVEDYELWLELRYGRQGTRFMNVPYVLMRHRIHKTSHFNNKNAAAVPELLDRMRKKFGK